MRQLITSGWCAVVLGAVLSVSGCSSYFKVTDIQSGKVYYSEEVDDLKGGAVKLKDAQSGSTVTIQNSEVKEISSKEYKVGLAAPVSKPAPAAVPAPTDAPAPSSTEAPDASGQ